MSMCAREHQKSFQPKRGVCVTRKAVRRDYKKYLKLGAY